MAQAGPNTTGTGANDASAGTTAWSNPTNITSSNNVYATATLNATVDSQYLKATNFGFAIPSGAVIDGIKVEWEIKANNGNAADNHVKIVKGGTISGTDKSAGAVVSTTEGFVSYGGSTDLWGVSWTAADINGSTFGAVYAGINTAVKENNTVISVDSCRITVFYHVGTAAFIIRILQ